MAIPSATEKRPSLWVLWLFACAVVLAVTGGYWLFAWLRTSHVDFGLAVLNRYGDAGYFPAISALAHGQFGEVLTVEGAGIGVQSIPFAGLAIHAACVRLLGMGGYVLADVIVGFLFLVSLYFLMSMFSGDRRWAVLASILVVSMVLQAPNDVLMNVGGLQGLRFWDLRIPRPFVTMIPFVLSLGFLFKILLQYPTYSPVRWWVALGIAYAWLVQGDIYLALDLGPAIAAAGIWMLVRGREYVRGFAVRAAAASAVLAGGLLMFLYQRVAEHPDIPRRLGAFPVAVGVALHSLRGAPPVYLVACLVACGVAWRLRGRLPPQPGSRGVLVTLLVLSISGYLSLLWSSQLVGFGIQIYHYPQAFYAVTSYVVLVCAMWIFAGARTQMRWGVFIRAMLVALAVAGSALMLRQHNNQAKRPMLRVGDSSGTPMSCLEQVLCEVRTHRIYQSCDVLGTLDPVMYLWWTAIHGGHVLMADPFNTVYGDREVERRLLAYCSLVGMSRDSLAGYLRTREAAGAFGHDKYQASRAYSFSGLEDYENDETDAILLTSIYDNWHLVIPRSERQRLLREFDALQIKGVFPRVDFFILRKGAWLSRPDDCRFVQTFKNDCYEIWVDRNRIDPGVR